MVVGALLRVLGGFPGARREVAEDGEAAGVARRVPGVWDVRVKITPRTTQPGWEVWWIDPPFTPRWDREGIESSTWLASRIARADAVALCEREGWEVEP